MKYGCSPFPLRSFNYFFSAMCNPKAIHFDSNRCAERNITNTNLSASHSPRLPFHQVSACSLYFAWKKNTLLQPCIANQIYAAECGDPGEGEREWEGKRGRFSKKKETGSTLRLRLPLQRPEGLMPTQMLINDGTYMKAALRILLNEMVEKEEQTEMKKRVWN